MKESIQEQLMQLGYNFGRIGASPIPTGVIHHDEETACHSNHTAEINSAS